jgi:hypothetical protein
MGEQIVGTPVVVVVVVVGRAMLHRPPWAADWVDGRVGIDIVIRAHRGKSEEDLRSASRWLVVTIIGQAGSGTRGIGDYEKRTSE